MQWKDWKIISSLVRGSSRQLSCAEDLKRRRKKCFRFMKALWMRVKFQRKWKTNSSNWLPKSTKSSNILTISSKDTIKFFWTSWRFRNKKKHFKRTIRCSSQFLNSIWTGFPSTIKSLEATTHSSSSTTESNWPKSPSRKKPNQSLSRQMWFMPRMLLSLEEWPGSALVDEIFLPFYPLFVFINLWWCNFL